MTENQLSSLILDSPILGWVEPVEADVLDLSLIAILNWDSIGHLCINSYSLLGEGGSNLTRACSGHLTITKKEECKKVDETNFLFNQ